MRVGPAHSILLACLSLGGGLLGCGAEDSSPRSLSARLVGTWRGQSVEAMPKTTTWTFAVDGLATRTIEFRYPDDPSLIDERLCRYSQALVGVRFVANDAGALTFDFTKAAAEVTESDCAKATSNGKRTVSVPDATPATYAIAGDTLTLSAWGGTDRFARIP